MARMTTIERVEENAVQVARAHGRLDNASSLISVLVARLERCERELHLDRPPESAVAMSEEPIRDRFVSVADPDLAVVPEASGSGKMF